MKFPLALIAAALLLTFPEAVVASAQAALRAWAFSVVPAMLPFMLLLPALISAEARTAYERLCGKLMRPLFDLPGSAAAGLLIGLAAGSPAGAMACVRVAREARLNMGEAKRMSLMCAGVSPVFLVSGVGVAMLGSADMGAMLMRAQLIAQLTLGVVLSRLYWRDIETLTPCDAPEPRAGVMSAVLAILGVGAYMLAFAAAGAVMSGIAGAKVGNAALMLMDMPSGAVLVAGSAYNDVAKIALLGFICGFGGLCIAAQNLSRLRDIGVSAREYIGAKLFTGGMTALIAYLQAASTRVSALEASAAAAVALLVPVLAAIRKRSSSETARHI